MPISEPHAANTRKVRAVSDLDAFTGPIPVYRTRAALIPAARCDGPTGPSETVPPTRQAVGPSLTPSTAHLQVVPPVRGNSTGADGSYPPPAAPVLYRIPPRHGDYQPLDPDKLAAIQWAQRHRDGWDTVGVAVAIAGFVWIAARCLPAIFPSLFN